jgi:hypothetical protein
MLQRGGCRMQLPSVHGKQAAIQGVSTEAGGHNRVQAGVGGCKRQPEKVRESPSRRAQAATSLLHGAHAKQCRGWRALAVPLRKI